MERVFVILKTQKPSNLCVYTGVGDFESSKALKPYVYNGLDDLENPKIYESGNVLLLHLFIFV